MLQTIKAFFWCTLIGEIDCVCGLLRFLGCWLNWADEYLRIKVHKFQAKKQQDVEANLHKSISKSRSGSPASSRTLQLSPVCCAAFVLYISGVWLQLYYQLPTPTSSLLSISLSFITFAFACLSLCPPLPCFLPLQKSEGDLFHRLWHVMNEILDLRRQVLVGHLTHDRMRDVKQHITARLDWGNEWVDGEQTGSGHSFSNVQNMASSAEQSHVL